MKNQETLFQEELIELTKLTQKYINLSGDNVTIKSLHQQLKELTKTDEDLDTVSFSELGANGQTITKKTIFGSFKIYIVAKDDNPSAIAQKFGFTLNRLTELQHPLFRKFLGLTQRVSLNNEAYRKIKPEDIVKDFWKNGQGTLWTLTEGDQLLIQEPSLDFLKKIKFTLIKKQEKATISNGKKNKKKKEQRSGIEFSASNGLVKGKTTQGNPEDYIDVTELFAAFGPSAGNSPITWSRVFLGLKTVADVLKLYLSTYTITDDVKQAVNNHILPSKQKVNTAQSAPFNVSVQYIDTIKQHLKNSTDKAKVKEIRNKINQQLAQKNLPNMEHDLYKFDGTFSLYIPSAKYKGHYIRRKQQAEEEKDFTTFYVITTKGLEPSPLAESGWLNRIVKKNK